MATPSLSDLILYTNTPLTDTDYEFNWQKVINYLTDGTADVTVDTLSATTSISVGGSDITALYPVGGMLDYGGDTAPTGWMICDGTAISRATYATLYAVIGTKYGVGDNSTTFNIPDYRNKLPIGASATMVIGTTGGSVTISEANLPSHLHTIGHSHSTFVGPETASHIHQMDYIAAVNGFTGSTFGLCSTQAGNSSQPVTPVAGQVYTKTESGSHSHTVAVFGTDTANSGSVGSGTDYLPPCVASNRIIKY